MPVVSDLPTPPLPDITATTCLKGARRWKAPGARFWGRRSSFMIAGTRPERRAWVSAAKIGSTRNPWAEAPCSSVSLALTAQPVQPRPNAESTSWAIGRAGDQLAEVGLGSNINVRHDAAATTRGGARRVTIGAWRAAGGDAPPSRP